MDVDDLDRLAKATEITFPRPLGIEESKELLGYIAENLPGFVDFQEMHNGRFRRDSKEDFISPEFYGILGRFDPSIVSNKFRMGRDFLLKDSDERDKIYFLNFSRNNLGWKLEKYPLEVRRLWGDVGSVVRRYFDGKE